MKVLCFMKAVRSYTSYKIRVKLEQFNDNATDSMFSCPNLTIRVYGYFLDTQCDLLYLFGSQVEL